LHAECVAFAKFYSRLWQSGVRIVYADLRVPQPSAITKQHWLYNVVANIQATPLLYKMPSLPRNVPRTLALLVAGEGIAGEGIHDPSEIPIRPRAAAVRNAVIFAGIPLL